MSDPKSNTSTPETDAVAWDYRRWHGTRKAVFAEHAQDMERQRDEAREMAARLADAITHSTYCSTERINCVCGAEAHRNAYLAFAATFQKPE